MTKVATPLRPPVRNNESWMMVSGPLPDLIRRRPNLVTQSTESWRPPLFEQDAKPPTALRRFFDLQAGSIWADLRQILPQACGTVVDVGCGARPYRSLFSNQVTYIGIDTADAKSHFGYEAPEVRYFQGESWPVADGSADFVLCTETMEHVPEPGRFLREAFRCLAPGGTLLLTVPFAARWHFIPHDYWRFTPSGLERLMTAAGFVQARVYARGNALTVFCYKAIALILRLALPQKRSPFAVLACRLAGLVFLPLLFLLAALAKISLRGPGGDDCLGYTALAVKGLA